jgi:Leucine-rich repeat (LRR) protein
MSLASRAKAYQQSRQQHGGVQQGGERSLHTIYRQARASGNLNLSNKQMQTIPPEICDLAAHIEEGEKFWECVDLARLDLSHNLLTNIPHEMNQNTSLTALKLSHNRLEYPDDFVAVFDLTSLATIDLSNNSISGDLSPRVMHLQTLVELKLSENSLAAVPEELGECALLESLHLNNNQLRTLPQSLANLQNLHTLNAGSNQLVSVPQMNMHRLKLLDLSCNSLTDGAIGGLDKLSSLTVLDLHENRLQAVPLLPAAAPLAQLTLGFNSISDLTGLLRCLTPASADTGGGRTARGGRGGGRGDSQKCLRDAISTLDLRDNKLRTLPPALALLESMQYLDLQNNDIVDLPHEIGYVRSLQRIALEGNVLRGIRRALISEGGSSSSTRSGNAALKRFLRSRGPALVGMREPEMEEGDEFSARDAEREAVSTSGAGGGDLRLRQVVLDGMATGVVDLSGLLTRHAPILPDEMLADRPQEPDDYSHGGGGGYDRGFDQGGGMEAAGASTVRRLVLNSNGLQQLPHGVHVLLKLAALEAESNMLTNLALSPDPNEAGAFSSSASAPGLWDLPNLASAKLDNNRLGQTGGFGGELGWMGLLHCSSLTEIDLSRNMLDVMPMALLVGLNPAGGARAPLPLLHTLMLGANAIRTLSPTDGPRGQNVPGVWSQSLTTLNLSGNQLSELDDLLHQRLPALTALDLGNNNLAKVGAIYRLCY